MLPFVTNIALSIRAGGTAGTKAINGRLGEFLFPVIPSLIFYEFNKSICKFLYFMKHVG